MNKEPYGRILHIIPAQPGWMAYLNDKGHVHARDIVCWALMEDAQGHTFVQGMVANEPRFDLIYAGDIDTHVLYLSPSQSEQMKEEGEI